MNHSAVALNDVTPSRGFVAFSEEARSALTWANRRSIESRVKTREILVSLMEQEGVAARALAALGGSSALQVGISELGEPEGPETGALPYAGRAIELAVSLAGQAGDPYVDTGHLLVALVSESDPAIVEFLNGEFGEGAETLLSAIDLARSRHPERPHDAS